MGRQVKSFDVEKCISNHEIEHETVFMEIPEGFRSKDSMFIICIMRLMVLKQSGNEFYKRLSSVMKEIGFKNLKSDPCVYFKRENGKMLIVGVHVDDTSCSN